MKLPRTVLDAMHAARAGRSALLGVAGAIAAVSFTAGCTARTHDSGADDAATATVSPEVAPSVDAASVTGSSTVTVVAASDASVDPLAAVDPTAPTPTPAPSTTSCVLPAGDLADGGTAARKPKPKKPKDLGQLNSPHGKNYCPPCGMG